MSSKINPNASRMGSSKQSTATSTSVDSSHSIKDNDSSINKNFRQNQQRRFASKNKSHNKTLESSSKLKNAKKRNSSLKKHSLRFASNQRKHFIKNHLSNLSQSEIRSIFKYFFRFHYFKKWRNALKQIQFEKNSFVPDLNEVVNQRANSLIDYEMSDDPQLSQENYTCQETQTKRSLELINANEYKVNTIEERNHNEAKEENNFNQQPAMINEETHELKSKLSLNIEVLNQLKSKLKACQSKKEIIASKCDLVKKESEKLCQLKKRLSLEENELTMNISKSSAMILSKKEKLQSINESNEKISEDLLVAKSMLESQLQLIAEAQMSLEKALQRKTQMEEELEDLRLNEMTHIKDITKQKEENQKINLENILSQKNIIFELDDFDSFSSSDDTFIET